MTPIAPEIFKAYDIRGVVDRTLDRRGGRARSAGRSARIAREQGGSAIVVGRDGRLSGPELAGALAARPPRERRRRDRHRHGRRRRWSISRPTTSAAAAASRSPAATTRPITTASRWWSPGRRSPPRRSRSLRARIEAGDFAAGSGALRTADVRAAYLERIVGDVKLARPMKIVVDCGNGVAGSIAPELYRRLGCEVDELFCEVDGTFPNHHPDPVAAGEPAGRDRARSPATDAELGLAFDGDGDRLGVVTKDGQIIYADRQLMLFAADVLSRVPGARDHLRREVHAQPRALDPRARRQAACCGRPGTRSSRRS